MPRPLPMYFTEQRGLFTIHATQELEEVVLLIVYTMSLLFLSYVYDYSYVKNAQDQMLCVETVS